MDKSEVVQSAPEVAIPSAGRFTAPGNRGARIPALDGVRGIAILLVLLRHAIFTVGAALHSGPKSPILSALLAAGQLTWSGVDLFFVLSGFLIGGILLDACDSPRYFQTFYIRRAYRILPLYFLVVAVFLFQHLPMYALVSPARFRPLEIPWWAYATFTQNFWMALLGTFGLNSAGITWSLAIEEQFYLTIPLLIRKIPVRALAAVLAGIICGAPLIRILLRSLWHDRAGLACYVLMPCRADALSFGVLAALVVRTPRIWDALVARRRVLVGITAVLFAGIALMSYRRYDAMSPAMTSWGYSLLAAFYTGFMLLALTGSGGWLERTLCYRPLRRLGTLAYCVYLIHIALMQAIRHPLSEHLRGAEAAAWIGGGVLGAAAAVAGAALSWEYYEKPLLRRGHRYQY